MKIVITGATGFIGRQIVPLLKSEGNELLLVGRDKQILMEMFPDTRATNYEHFEKEAHGFDILVHLAVLNNDALGDISKFRSVNVDLLQRVLDGAKRAKIHTFVNTTTLHVTEGTRATHYSKSKSEGDDILLKAQGIHVLNLRLPAVYGTSFAGRLGIINRLPKPVRPAAFFVLASLKPTVHARKVADAIMLCPEEVNYLSRIISDRQLKNPVYAFLSRVIDLGFSFSVLILFWWFLLIIWLYIKFSSSGPALFSQERIGKHGLKFTCYKFRTMYVGTKNAGTHEISRSSITPFGHFLRRTKIDELPQVWNIIRNQLSLVGPRPCLPVQTKLIDARARKKVFDVNAGITGLAQVQGVDMSDEILLSDLDAEYVALRSIPFDLKIIFQTLLGRGLGDRIR